MEMNTHHYHINKRKNYPLTPIICAQSYKSLRPSLANPKQNIIATTICVICVHGIIGHAAGSGRGGPAGIICTIGIGTRTIIAGRPIPG